MSVLHRNPNSSSSAGAADHMPRHIAETEVTAPGGWGSRGRWICAGIAGMLVVAVVWQTFAKDRLIAKRWGVVEPGRIFRSGQVSAYLIKPMLRNHGIQVVVDLTEADPKDRNQAAEQAAIAELGIDLERCPLIGDGTGDPRNFIRALQALARARRAGKPVLVHCSAGAQRTGSVVAAWRLLVEKRSPAFAYAELQSYGWRPVKDDILRVYLNAHLRELAEALQRSGVIDQVPAPIPQLGP